MRNFGEFFRRVGTLNLYFRVYDLGFCGNVSIGTSLFDGDLPRIGHVEFFSFALKHGVQRQGFIFVVFARAPHDGAVVFEIEHELVFRLRLDGCHRGAPVLAERRGDVHSREPVQQR